ncbi:MULTISPECIES: hypothetical protein [unclassified Azospirillum]|uniref:hypothetical protein n=1 Tax=unclassified Azospirillum TaxID=2630922 RepID=UPI001304B4DA|nr:MULTISPECIES: hypothetical protein [unclassified Azospirillum]
MFRIALAALILTLAGPAVAQQCGFPPMGTVNTMNCTPICICDASGQSCYWRWECPR